MLGSIVHQRTPCLLDDLTLIQKEIRFRIHILQACIISVGSSYHYRINPRYVFSLYLTTYNFVGKNRRRRGSMIVFFTTTRAISAYYH